MRILLFLALIFTACLPDNGREIAPPPQVATAVQSISSTDIEQIRDTAMRTFILSKIEEAAIHDSFRLDSTFPAFKAQIVAGPLLQPNQKVALIGYASSDNPENYNIHLYTWDKQRRSYTKGGFTATLPFIEALRPQIGDLNKDGLTDILLPLKGDKHAYLLLGNADGGLSVVSDYAYYADIQFDSTRRLFKATHQYNCPDDKSKNPKYVTCKTTFLLAQQQGFWQLNETSRDCPCKPQK